MATPWQSPSTIDWNETKYFMETVMLSNYSQQVKEQLWELIGRRLLLALRNQKNLLGMPWNAGLIVLKETFPFLRDLKNY
jgi:hypothetical protein